MKYIGSLCLLAGIAVMISSYPGDSQSLPSWTNIIGGGLIIFSYFIIWRE